MAVPRTRHRYTIEDWDRMIAEGILGEDDRVELIRGEIVEMSPIGGDHLTAVNLLVERLIGQVERGVMVSAQNPIRLPGDSEPQPDLSLVRKKRYRVPPQMGDVFFVIEVADSSRRYDRNTKLPLYAEAGIPEAWLFDLIDNRIERHTEPGPTGYRQVATAERGESLVSTVLPTLTLSIDDAIDLEE